MAILTGVRAIAAENAEPVARPEPRPKVSARAVELWSIVRKNLPNLVPRPPIAHAAQLPADELSEEDLASLASLCPYFRRLQVSAGLQIVISKPVLKGDSSDEGRAKSASLDGTNSGRGIPSAPISIPRAKGNHDNNRGHEHGIARRFLSVPDNMRVPALPIGDKTPGTS